MSDPVHGIQCQEPGCATRIGNVHSEEVLFAGAAQLGFKKIEGVWLCQRHAPKSARLHVVDVSLPESA